MNCRKCEIEQKEEKERKRREREERRKARYFAQMKLKETVELKKKIVKEEKKLLKAQRKLEAIRLIEELFKRIDVGFIYFRLKICCMLCFAVEKGKRRSS